MKVLVCTPSLSRAGGVANYYSVLRKHFTTAVEYAAFGRRSDAVSGFAAVRQLLRDYAAFVARLRAGDVDLVHINPSMMPAAVSRDALLVLLAKWLGIPVIVFFRGWNPTWAARFMRYAPFLFTRIFFRADAIIVLADAFRDTLRRLGYQGSIYVKTTVVDDEAFASASGADETPAVRLLFLSRLDVGKGLHETIEAFGHARNRFPQLELVVAGDGPEKAVAERTVAARGITGVTFIGYVTGQEKESAFSGADIYILPSHSEGMPNVVLEAMACGLPVITRPVGGLKDFFEDGRMGFLLEDHDAEALADRIGRLVEDPVLRRRMGRYNRDYARQRFAASRVVRRLEAIYVEVQDGAATNRARPGRPSKLAWYIARLRVMGLREVVHRVGERVTIEILRRDFARRSSPSYIAEATSHALSFCTAPEALLPDLPWAFDPDPATVEGLLAGEAPAMGHAWRWTDDPAVWHTAPDTGRRWPRCFFADVPYRPGNPIGDARIMWEPARLQHLVALGLLFRTTADPKHREQAVNMARRQLTSFVAANTDGEGIHHVSALELGLRIMAVCYAADLLRPAVRNDDAFWSAVVRLVDGHARLIVRRLSLHSSAGNHTIGECAGLIFAGLLFPELPDAEHWIDKALPLMAVEANRQILADGAGAEQAFAYTVFIVDLIGLVVRLSEHHGRAVPETLRHAWDRGRSFLGLFGDRPGTLPPVGDADGGHALSPYLRLSWHSNSAPSRGPLLRLASSGYSLVRDRDVDVLFDHGPLGMAPSYGHGHADALSVIVSVDGQGVFVDPGTFSYADARWRTYFRGTAAHNTVLVDGRDQARQRSPFMWADPYTAELMAADETDGHVHLLARHDGYASVGVRHWRAVHFDRTGSTVTVWDHLAGAGDHALDLNWHISGTVEMTREGAVIRREGEAMAAVRVDGGTARWRTGEENPICGWVSPAYGVRHAAWTVRASWQGKLPHTFVTVIALRSETVPPLPDPTLFERDRERVR